MNSARFSELDESFMRRAIQIARRAEGRVEPNPMVGCVLVRNGKIIGEGHHRKFGGPHAEVHALRHAKKQRNRTKGATAYVTLEPCGHHGKTPPCTEALIEAGISRVVAGVRDPGIHVAGRGFKRLRQAGITVDSGCLEEDARELIAPYVTLNEKQRPYIILKWAQSIDGKISTPKNQPNAISGSESHRWVHRLRARVDGILVGIGTVLADDPQLTARDVPMRRTATRIVLDSNLRIPPAAKLIKSAKQTPTLIFTSTKASKSTKAKSLTKKNVEIIPCPSSGGRLNPSRILETLGQRQMSNLLVEGGADVHSTLIRKGLADEICTFVSPRIIGQNEKSITFDRSPDIRCVTSQQIGDDMLWRFRLNTNVG